MGTTLPGHSRNSTCGAARVTHVTHLFGRRHRQRAIAADDLTRPVPEPPGIGPSISKVPDIVWWR